MDDGVDGPASSGEQVALIHVVISCEESAYNPNASEIDIILCRRVLGMDSTPENLPIAKNMKPKKLSNMEPSSDKKSPMLGMTSPKMKARTCWLQSADVSVDIDTSENLPR